MLCADVGLGFDRKVCLVGTGLEYNDKMWQVCIGIKQCQIDNSLLQVRNPCRLKHLPKTRCNAMIRCHQILKLIRLSLIIWCKMSWNIKMYQTRLITFACIFSKGFIILIPYGITRAKIHGWVKLYLTWPLLSGIGLSVNYYKILWVNATSSCWLRFVSFIENWAYHDFKAHQSNCNALKLNVNIY